MTDARPSCRRGTDRGPRMLPTHLAGCEKAGCPGCQPCPERHCQVCHRAHVTVDGRGTDQTCAPCLSAARTRLAGIWTMATALLGEAISRGINAAAANLAGPVADVETWSNRRASVLAGRVDPGWLTEQGKELADDDVAHPLWTLATWEWNVRIHLGQVLSPGTSRPTLTEARDYLDHHLTWLAHDETFDFAGLAHALADCHAHVERSLALEEHVDTGARCPECQGARVVKSYGATDEDDRWTCPRCKQWWSEYDYRAKVAATYLEHAEVLTASQINQQYRVPEATIRSWVARERIKHRGRDEHGRQLFDVKQVLALRDNGAA